VHQRNPSADGFYRLFMVPGMAHCGGGPGPNTFDSMTPLVNWVEHGIAPEKLIATKYADDHSATVVVQRPVCPHPQVARYRGSGDPNRAESFTCAAP
jgi:feruloyl esterase